MTRSIASSDVACARCSRILHRDNPILVDSGEREFCSHACAKAYENSRAKFRLVSSVFFNALAVSRRSVFLRRI
jgi:hypothetical protein